MTILPFIKKEFNFLTFCFAFQNNSWKMTPNATSVSCSFFYWWLMTTVTQRKLQRFWTPFLSVNSFQLLWKTCVRWCAWNRVFVSIATLEQLTGLACFAVSARRNDEPKASDDTRGWTRLTLVHYSWIRAQIPQILLARQSKSLKNRKILDDFWG